MTTVIAAGQLESVATAQLEAEAVCGAGRIAALMCRWLMVIAELDRREAWREWECTSMAHWLSWKCGLSLVTGRDHVRVARALESLPVVREHFAAGRLSFSKVRALTRIIRAEEMEPVLVQFAMDATAAQIDRVAAAYRTVDRLADVDLVRASFERRRAVRRLDDSGCDSIEIRGPRDLVAEIWETLGEVMRTDVPADEGDTVDQRRFDALAAACRRLRAPQGVDRPPVTLVVRVHTPLGGAVAVGEPTQLAVPALLGGVPVGPAALRRLVEDADHVVEQNLDDGSVARARPTPAIPRPIRRSVGERDGWTCRWPSCTHRGYLHAHHIVWRSHGGTHEPSNLILLCSAHHAKVHLGGWSIEGGASDPTFVAPDGRRASNRVGLGPVSVTDALEALERDGVRIDEHTIDTAYGEPLDLHYAVSVFLDAEALARRRN